MTAIPCHRGQLGFIIVQPNGAVAPWEKHWWQGRTGYVRVVLILVLVVLLAHGYPVPVA